jgi:hypothetical protein
VGTQLITIIIWRTFNLTRISIFASCCALLTNGRTSAVSAAVRASFVAVISTVRSSSSGVVLRFYLQLMGLHACGCADESTQSFPAPAVYICKSTAIYALFSLPQSSKFFHSLSITSIFNRLYGVLNIGKKITNYTV